MSLHRVREEVFEEGRFARSQPMSGNNLYYTDTARQSMHQANSPGAVRDAKAAPSVPGSWPAEQAPLSGRAPYGVAQPVSQVVTMIGPQRPKNLFGPQSTANGDQKLTKINDSNPFA